MDSYVEMLIDAGNQFASFLNLAADYEYWPLLFHCTAGKDRTGLAAALILELCGVERTQAFDDYELTNRLRSEKRIREPTPSLRAAGADIEAIRPALSAPRAAMQQTLDDDTFGGTENFCYQFIRLRPRDSSPAYRTYYCNACLNTIGFGSHLRKAKSATC